MGDPVEERLDAVNQAGRYLRKVRQPIEAIINQLQKEKVNEIEREWTNEAYKRVKHMGEV